MSASELLTRLKLVSIERQGVALEILYHWVTKFWVDFAVNPSLLAELRSWLQVVRPADDVAWLHAETRVTGRFCSALAKIPHVTQAMRNPQASTCLQEAKVVKWLAVSTSAIPISLFHPVMQSSSRFRDTMLPCCAPRASHGAPMGPPKALSIK